MAKANGPYFDCDGFPYMKCGSEKNVEFHIVELRSYQTVHNVL